MSFFTDNGPHFPLFPLYIKLSLNLADLSVVWHLSIHHLALSSSYRHSEMSSFLFSFYPRTLHKEGPFRWKFGGFRPFFPSISSDWFTPLPQRYIELESSELGLWKEIEVVWYPGKVACLEWSVQLSSSSANSLSACYAKFRTSTKPAWTVARLTHRRGSTGYKVLAFKGWVSLFVIVIWTEMWYLTRKYDWDETFPWFLKYWALYRIGKAVKWPKKSDLAHV